MSVSTINGVLTVDAPLPGGAAVVVGRARLHPTVGGHLRREGLRIIDVLDVASATRLLADRDVAIAVVETATPATTGAIMILSQAARDAGHHTDVVAVGAPDTTTTVAALQAGAIEVFGASVSDAEFGLRLRLVLDQHAERLNVLSRLDYLEWLNGTDVLTGLPNRRSLTEELSRHASVAGRHGLSLAVVMFDVDRFKQINDRVGHGGGDATLCEVGVMLRAGVREGDVVGRWGGDEFLALLPHTPLEEAEVMAERILRSLADSPLVYGDFRIPVTMSAGCTATPGTSADLLTRCDLAMYDSKAAGRNRVRVRS
jgi:diguanylate cyclase (GGDEF)-like protein